MDKTCVKCGNIQTIEDPGLQIECPKCGVIYAKAEALVSSREQEKNKENDEQKKVPEIETPSNRRSSIFNFLVLGCVACLFLYLYFGRETVEVEEKKVITQTVEQRGRTESGRKVQEQTFADDMGASLTETEENMDPVIVEQENITEPAQVERKDNYASTSVKNNQVNPEIQENKILLPVERPSLASTRKEPVDYYMAETTISKGKEVILDEHMSDRRFTVFYFYADW